MHDVTTDGCFYQKHGPENTTSLLVFSYYMYNICIAKTEDSIKTLHVILFILIDTCLTRDHLCTTDMTTFVFMFQEFLFCPSHVDVKRQS